MMKNLTKLLLATVVTFSFAHAYEPRLPATNINGVSVYLLAEDGEPNEDGLIDQFWLKEQIEKGTLPKGLHIVDIRKAEKFKASHVKDAISVPFDKDEEELDTSKLPKDGVIVFYCNTGVMSTDARGSLDDELANRVLIFDATYKCDKETYKNCELTPNEAL